MLARPVSRAWRLCTRCYATSTSTAPPMLLKIRADMKKAMIAKDSNRLSVLKSLMTQTLNASKTANPINSDLQILALLRKGVASGKAASEEFRGAGRADLAEKEESQVKIMKEYMGGVEVMGEEEMREVVKGVVESMKGETKEGEKLMMGNVLKKVFSPEVLGGKPVEKADVARVVKELMA